MTKTQIWVAAFLALFLLLFFISRLTKEEKEESRVPTQNTVPQTGMSSEQISVKDLVSKLGCISCHGRDLNGTPMGPGLYKVKQYWTRDQLINYLRNPSSYMDSDRFQEYKNKYPGIMMPSFGEIDVKELGKISEYLLKLE